MGRKSSITTLPPELRAEIDRLLADGRFTIEAIVAHLVTLGADLSRSAVGRYKQRFDAVADKLRQSRQMADALVAEIGPAAAEGKTARLLVEILQNIVFNHLLDRAEGDEGASAQDLMRLGKALKDLASASKIDADREIAIRREFARDAAKAATGVARNHGLSAEVIAEIERDVLGLVR